MVISNQLSSQCTPYTVSFTQSNVTQPNASGMQQVDVLFNFNIDTDINFMQVIFDVVGAKFDCSSSESVYAQSKGFDEVISGSETRITLSRSVGTATINDDDQLMMRLVFKGNLGDNFTFSMNFQGSFYFPPTPCNPSNTTLTGSGTFPLDVFSGNISRPSGVVHCSGAINGGVPNVIVTNDYFINNTGNFCFDDLEEITGFNGNYSFDSDANLEQTISCTSDASILCGLEEADIDIIRSFILGFYTFYDAWEPIAADFNNDNIIDGGDMVAIRKTFDGTTTNTYKNWKYPLSKSYALAGLGPFWGVPSVDYEYEHIGGWIVPTIDFVAIKNGDMNTSCTDCTSTFQQEDDIVSRSLLNSTKAYISSRTVSIPMDAGLTMIQLTVKGNFEDKDVLLLSSNNIDYVHTTFQPDSESSIIYIYRTTRLDGKISDELSVTLSADFDEIEGFGKNLNFDKIKLDFIDNRLTITPNPTSDRIYIQNIHGEKYQIISMSGEVIETGVYDNFIDVGNYESGVYYIKILSKYYESEKFIKL